MIVATPKQVARPKTGRGDRSKRPEQADPSKTADRGIPPIDGPRIAQVPAPHDESAVTDMAAVAAGPPAATMHKVEPPPPAFDTEDDDAADLARRIMDCEVAVAANPSGSDTLADLARLYAQDGRLAAAQQMFERALPLAAGMHLTDILIDLGVVYQKLGHYTQAHNCYE